MSRQINYNLVKINNVKVVPYWLHTKKEKAVTDLHAEIIDEAFPNIICCGRKKIGKTTTCLYMLKHFMTTKTKLVIFSPDILNSSASRKAIEKLEAKFDEDNVVVYNQFSNEAGENDFQAELDEAKVRYREEQEDGKSKYSFPSTIFFFDDLNILDLKSKELGDFAQNNRHYGALAIYSSQDWLNFEIRLRKNVDLLLLWSGISTSRLKDIYDTVQINSTFDSFKHAYEKAFKHKKATKRHNFFYIDVVKKELRQNFDSKYEAI